MLLGSTLIDDTFAEAFRMRYARVIVTAHDAHWAAACGTPEPGGLTPGMVVAVIRAVGREFELVGADLVELAPGLSLDREASARSIATAALYTRETLAALGGNQPE